MNEGVSEFWKELLMTEFEFLRELTLLKMKQVTESSNFGQVLMLR